MSTIEDKYKYTTARESIINTDWAAGARKEITAKIWTVSYINNNVPIVRYMKQSFAPAWYKQLDEAIVNCADQYVRAKGQMCTLKCNFDSSNGAIKIYNDGPGIEVHYHSIAKKYVPEMLISDAFQGSNNNSNTDSITGGVNGIGIKIANYFSNWFTVDTYDRTTGQQYKQRWEDHGAICKDPEIIKCKMLGHTCIEFCPDYKMFGSYIDQLSVFETIMCARVWAISAYMCFYKTVAKYTRDPIITFNESPVDITLKKFAELVIESKIQLTHIPNNDVPSNLTSYTTHHCILKNAEHPEWPWEICIIVSPNAGKHTFSNVNGIIVDSGAHIRYLYDQLFGPIEIEVSKIFKDQKRPDIIDKQAVVSHLSIFANVILPRKLISWSGQRKEKLDGNIDKFANWKFKPKFLTEIAQSIAKLVIQDMIEKQNKHAINNTKRIPRDEKRIDALRVGSSKHECTLLVVEGDSAKTCAQYGRNKDFLGADLYGILTAQGVIENIRKRCIEMDTGKILLVGKTTEFLPRFMTATGLQFGRSYNTLNSLKSLRYRYVCALVDQDLDGDNICALLQNFIALFWPELFTHGFMQKLETPIKIASRKCGNNIEKIKFYNENEYDQWIKTTPNISNYKIKYYKGLGTHRPEDMPELFQNINDHLITFRFDKKAKQTYEVYYGYDTDLRKHELSRPINLCDSMNVINGIANASDYLTKRVFLYCKDNLERKLDHIMDGLNQGGRKIIMAAMDYFRGNRMEARVAQFGGFITERANYHHGEMSLQKSIFGKAYYGPGGIQVPIMADNGMFGTRLKGGADHASGRYACTGLINSIAHTLYIKEDMPLLPYTPVDGSIYEPDYFAPIIPMIVCENKSLPAHGWKLKMWARDVDEVIAYVRFLITNPLSLNKATTLHMYKGAWTGTTTMYNGQRYSLGKYIWCDESHTKLCITELPYRKWTTKYVDNLRNEHEGDPESLVARFIEDIEDSGDVNTIEIYITLSAAYNPNEISLTVSSDPIIMFLKLYKAMDDCINILGIHHEVLSFTRYDQVIQKWFVLRRSLYEQRSEYMSTIYYERWRYESYRHKFLISSITLNECNIDQGDVLLEQAGFPRLNRVAFNPPLGDLAALKKALQLDCTYSYIYKLKIGDKLIHNVEKQAQRVHDEWRKYKEHMAIINAGSFKGAHIWLNELDAFENALHTYRRQRNESNQNAKEKNRKSKK